MPTVSPYNSQFSGEDVDASVAATAQVVSTLPTTDLDDIPSNKIFIYNNAAYHCVHNEGSSTIVPLVLDSSAVVTKIKKSSTELTGAVNVSNRFSVNSTTNTLDVVGLPLVTTPPGDYAASNTLQIAIVSTAPAQYKPGWLYLIKE